MQTLHVENVPDEVYEAIRAHARKQRSSIAAEVIRVLERTFPTAKELRRRQVLFRRFLRMQAAASPGPVPFPSAETMLRELRDR